MSEVDLRQPIEHDESEFKYSACRPFTKNMERVQTFRETGESRYIYINELDKSCFVQDLGF